MVGNQNPVAWGATMTVLQRWVWLPEAIDPSSKLLLAQCVWFYIYIYTCIYIYITQYTHIRKCTLTYFINNVLLIVIDSCQYNHAFYHLWFMLIHVDSCWSLIEIMFYWLLLSICCVNLYRLYPFCLAHSILIQFS